LGFEGNVSMDLAYLTTNKDCPLRNESSLIYYNPPRPKVKETFKPPTKSDKTKTKDYSDN